jgi:glycosyltransferase involved in cell wall biosynthesis
MKNAPLVTIGMPTYNGQEYISIALDALLSQSYSQFEIIISDDASTDKTQQICQEYATRDERIHFIKQNRNLGFVKNFNYVLDKAKGDYFMWAGQDDLWDKNFVATLLELLQNNPNTVLAMSNFQNIHEGKKYFVYKKTHFNNTWSKYKTLIHFLKTTNLSYFYGLYKTSALKKAGGYHADSRPIAKSSDYVTIFRTLLDGKMVYTKEILFFKRDTGLYTNRYLAVRNNLLSRQTVYKIKRFLFYPLFYIYDAVYCIKFLSVSDFPYTRFCAST